MINSLYYLINSHAYVFFVLIFFIKIKYVGDENQGFLEMTGLNLMDKTFYVQGVTISFSIWDVGGESNSYLLIK